MNPKYVTAFYVVGLAHHLFTSYYTNNVDYSKTTDPKILDIKEFSMRYLTTWNMVLQTIYFTIAIIIDLLYMNKDKIDKNTLQKISNAKGYFFSTMIFPCATVVATFFWTLFWINREFVMPKAVDDVFPFWVNHCIHTNILLLPLVELSMPKMYIPSVRSSLIGITIFTIIYDAQYMLTYYATGKWLYPIFDHLSWPQRMGFFFFIFSISLVFYVFGLIIQNMKSDRCSVSKPKSYKKTVANVTKKLL